MLAVTSSFHRFIVFNSPLVIIFATKLFGTFKCYRFDIIALLNLVRKLISRWSNCHINSGFVVIFNALLYQKKRFSCFCSSWACFETNCLTVIKLLMTLKVFTYVQSKCYISHFFLNEKFQWPCDYL